MKKAVKWTLTRLKKAVVNVDQVKKGSGRCQPGRKEQDGQHQPRKQKWSTSMTFFMTYCLVKNVAPKKSLYSNVFGYIFLQLVIKSAADIDHCTFLGQHWPLHFSLIDVNHPSLFYLCSMLVVVYFTALLVTPYLLVSEFGLFLESFNSIFLFSLALICFGGGLGFTELFRSLR